MIDLVDAMTERLLRDAGVGPGMRVLDAGCGPGVVVLMLAERVGARGEVVGLDRNPALLAKARESAAAQGLAQVTFIEGDLLAPPAALGTFDAVMVRRVLMYLPDPLLAVQALARLLRPGGVFIVHEHDVTLGAGSSVSGSLPLHELVHTWIWQTVQREGANPRLGLALPSLLRAAGLQVEQMRAEAVIETPEQRRPVGPILRAMLPRLIAQGVVAGADEVGVDTIDERLIAERTQANATYVGELVIGVWARSP